jgi:uncharacterized membrane protein
VSVGHSHADPLDDTEVLGRRARLVRAALAALVIPLLAATVTGVVLLWPAHRHHPIPVQFQNTGGGAVAFVTGRVARLDHAPCGTATPGAPLAPTRCVEIHIKLSDGTMGTIEYPVSQQAGVPTFHLGDRVRLARTRDPITGGAMYSFDDFVRGMPLALFAGLFALVVIVVARWRGLAALVGLGFTYLVVAYFLLPALLDGESPVQVGLVAAAAIMFVVLYLAHGVTARTTTALLGTFASLLIAAGLSGLALHGAHITGLSSEANTTLQAVTTGTSVTGLLLCGFIIGSLGVLNDMTVTQASAVWELRAAAPHTGAWHLFNRAMRIGRDHIASTVYTLVLAYAGAALPVLLLFSLSGRSVHDVITGDEISTEILRSLVGATGLVLAVPITTALAAVVVTASGAASPDPLPPPLEEEPKEMASVAAEPRPWQLAWDD